MWIWTLSIMFLRNCTTTEIMAKHTGKMGFETEDLSAAPRQREIRVKFHALHTVFDVKFCWNFPSHTQTLEKLARKISPKIPRQISRHLWQTKMEKKFTFVELFRGRPRGGDNLTSLFQVRPFTPSVNSTLSYRKSCNPVSGTPSSTAWHFRTSAG